MLIILLFTYRIGIHLDLNDAYFTAIFIQIRLGVPTDINIVLFHSRIMTKDTITITIMLFLFIKKNTSLSTPL